MKKNVVYFCVLGCLYILAEFFFRAFSFDIMNYSTKVYYESLIGISSVWMFFVGGLCGTLLGALNENAWINKHLNIFVQSVIGMVIITVLEFTSGLILNVWLHLHIWSYAGLPGNVLGQICPQFAVIWLLLSPFAFWADDVVRHYLWGKTAPYTLYEIYINMINPFAKPF